MQFTVDYDCIYSAKGTIIDKGGNRHKVSVPLDHYACYGDIYRKIRNNKSAKIEYKIYLFKEDAPQRGFNLCTKLETKKILRSLRKIVDFSYKFSKAQYKSGQYTKKLADFNVLEVTVDGNYAQHLWLTTMLRCFYEYPYNVAAKEACVLQSTYEGEDIDISKANWINLYLTIAAKTGSTRLHGIVDFCRQPLAYTYKEWKQKLENCQEQNDIIEYLRSNHTFKDRWSTHIDEEAYNKGVKNRAAKYVAAYKEKISWKK